MGLFNAMDGKRKGWCWRCGAFWQGSLALVGVYLCRCFVEGLFSLHSIYTGPLKF